MPVRPADTRPAAKRDRARFAPGDARTVASVATNETLISVAARIRTGEQSPLEAVDAALERIAATDADLNALCEVRASDARAQAVALGERLAHGAAVGPLAGVPIGVKDLENATGFRTTFGDPAHASDPPATRDSVEVARLRAAGAVVVAKTNTPAYGFHAETNNLVFGPTRNPWAPGRTCGGSSGGSAVAVASGMLTLATGSDGGGSIRIPSETCGICGFKPTHGVVPGGDDEPPTWGHLSTRGPMARTFPEIALALDVVKGISNRDLLSFDLPGSFVEAASRASVEGLRIAWSPTLGYAHPDPAVLELCEAALRALEANGARVVETVEQVFDGHPGGPWSLRAAAGSWAVVSAGGGAWEERFLPEARFIPRFGEHLTGVQVHEGDVGAHLANLRVAELWERVDLLVTPGMATVPPRIGELSPYGAGWAADYTLPFNLVRAPAAVVPAGFVSDDSDSLPIGVQLVAPRGADLALMRAAAAVDAILGFSARRPPRSAGN
jgi:aspartyl-tRNA(Asn)/glutamyl-tRNA(Gln) amidotransferase subunit A